MEKDSKNKWKKAREWSKVALLSGIFMYGLSKVGEEFYKNYLINSLEVPEEKYEIIVNKNNEDKEYVLDKNGMALLIQNPEGELERVVSNNYRTEFTEEYKEYSENVKNIEEETNGLANKIFFGMKLAGWSIGIPAGIYMFLKKRRENDSKN